VEDYSGACDPSFDRHSAHSEHSGGYIFYIFLEDQHFSSYTGASHPAYRDAVRGASDQNQAEALIYALMVVLARIIVGF
jgi:hypothetical protein